MNKSSVFPFIFSFCVLFISCKTVGETEVSEEQQAAKSEILWDSWDVPHIYAGTTPDLGYGFGRAQMKSYGNDILKLYGLARGRGAEFWGEKYLSSDRLLNSVGIPQSAAEILDKQSPGFRSYLQAFADGMNDYADEHPQEIRADVLGVLPVQAEDLIRHTQRMFFTFASLSGNSPPILGLNGLPAGRSIGSNTIAVGPSRSQSGNAMLLQNPHLPWNMPFMRFFEAQLAGPDFDLYGTTLIGLPVIIIGFNKKLGWSHTVNTVDLLDTYQLKLDENGYRFDGKILPFEESTEILKVRQEDGSVTRDTLKIRRSIHGPVIQSTDSTAIAIRTPLLERHGKLRQYWDMGKSQNFEQFQSALKQLQSPMFTTSYADRDGHIYYLFNGQVPKRPHGDFDFWQQPVAGDTSATLWSEIHSFEELPALLDPESGFVQNSNSPPWFATVPSTLDPNDYPAYMAPEWLLPREQRGIEMLLSDNSISFEELIDIRYSNRMLLADRVLEDLLPAAGMSADSLTRAAGEVLGEWDHYANADSEGALLFTLWASESCRGGITNFCDFMESWDPNHPITTPYGLADPEGAAALLGKVAKNVHDQFGRLNVPWGDVMRISDDIPGIGAPGDPLGVYHVMSYQPTENGEYRPVHGDTWVAVIEFTKNGPRAEVLISYGNRSQSDPAANNGQLKLLSNKEMRPVWNTRELVEENLKERTEF